MYVRRMFRPAMLVCPCALLLFACAAEDTEPPVDHTQFAFPIAEPELIDQYIGVDHDPEVQQGGASSAICTSYDGRVFPWCYDEHHGSDYTLDGSFETMDNGSATVLAAAAGMVISVHDGEYDRCHIEDLEVTCDGNPIIANHVIIDHGDSVTKYWHLMKESILVTEGQQVECGDPLALVGSSGNSSLPHLHFQLEVDGEVVDPYAGEHSQTDSWWLEQGEPEGLPGSACPTAE